MLAPAATSEGAAVWRCCAEDATADADAFCEVNALCRGPNPPHRPSVSSENSRHAVSSAVSSGDSRLPPKSLQKYLPSRHGTLKRHFVLERTARWEQ